MQVYIYHRSFIGKPLLETFLTLVEHASKIYSNLHKVAACKLIGVNAAFVF